MNDDQLLRYSRQIMLPSFGIEGQEALLESRVLIIGLGGLGSPVAMYLAAAGVGNLVLVDFDKADFIGKSALEGIRSEGVRRKVVGIFMDGDAFEKNNEHRWPVFSDAKKVGHVSSAVYSPRLERNIGFALLDAAQAGSGSFWSWRGGHGGWFAVGFMLGTLSIGFGPLGQPHLLNRLMAMKSARDIRLARAIALTWFVLVLCGRCRMPLPSATMNVAITFLCSLAGL